MDKTYTAQEMREMEKSIVRVDAMDGLTCREHCYPMEQVVRAMLRQAADAMEREEKRIPYHEYPVVRIEEKREKKYEYAAVLSNGKPSSIHDEMFALTHHCFRREVGEWEEVKDGE